MSTSKIQIELPIFDINTSEKDILTLRSCFNPYPEKAAEGGLLVWTISHPMTNPGGWIMYPATGEVYYTQTPLSYASETEISAPEVSQTEPPDYGDGHGRWMSLTDYVSYMSRGFVRGAQHSRADLSKVDAVLQSAEVKVLSPRQKFVELVRLAARLIDEGDFYTASVAIDYGSHSGQYTDIFEYHCWQMAIDVCPSLPVDDQWGFAHQGYASSIGYTANEIDTLLQTTIDLVAYRMLLAQSSDVAKGYITAMIGLTKAQHERVTTALRLKKSTINEESYLDMVHAYFLGTGIEL